MASVELRRHPELAGLPVIVGGNGDPDEPRKVVTCASYEARKSVVHAGMPLRAAARRCPDATFLPSDPPAYEAASEQVMGLLRDLGHPVEALWSVGPKTTKRLAMLGITTVRELPHSDAEVLTSTFGARTGLWLLLLAKGGGDADVSAEPWVPRSGSHVVTFPRDLTDRSEMDSAISELARRALDDVVASSRIVIPVAVTVRTATFYTRTKIRKLTTPTADPDVIVVAAALEMLDLFGLDRPIRLLGVRLELTMPR